VLGGDIVSGLTDKFVPVAVKNCTGTELVPVVTLPKFKGVGTAVKLAAGGVTPVPDKVTNTGVEVVVVPPKEQPTIH
jgi:hypothetical protein